MEEGQQLAAGCMDAHAVGVDSAPAPSAPDIALCDTEGNVDSAPAPSAPDIALGVTADTVRESGLEVGENFPAAQRGAIAHVVEHDDVGGILRPVGGAGVHDVAPLEVRREADAVRAPHRALGRDGRLPARIETIDAGGKLELGLVPFIRPENPVAPLGAPDRALRIERRILV